MRCIICQERPTASRGGTAGAFCFQCGRSYDRDRNADGGTMLDTIDWAARRARYFEQRRRKLGQRPRVEEKK